MKAQDLRIGNWIKHDGLFHEISSTNNWNSFITVMFRCEVSLSDIEFIPLTEERLDKFGFHIGEHWGQGQEGIYCTLGSFKVWMANNGDIRVDQFKRKLDWVHELQNGYHYDTGEELEIKPSN